MAAPSWRIKIEEGSQFDLYVRWYDSECSAKSIAGYGARFQVRTARLSTGVILYQADVGGSPGVITLEPDSETGLFHIKLPVTTVNSPTQAWTDAEWDLVAWPSGGSITDQAKRLVGGKAVWSPSAVFA